MIKITKLKILSLLIFALSGLCAMEPPNGAIDLPEPGVARKTASAIAGGLKDLAFATVGFAQRNPVLVGVVAFSMLPESVVAIGCSSLIKGLGEPILGIVTSCPTFAANLCIRTENFMCCESDGGFNLPAEDTGWGKCNILSSTLLLCRKYSVGVLCGYDPYGNREDVFCTKI